MTFRSWSLKRDDFLAAPAIDRFEEDIHRDDIRVAPGAEDCRLVHHISQVGAGHAGRPRSKLGQVDPRGERLAAGMDLEDRRPRGAVALLHGQEVDLDAQRAAGRVHLRVIERTQGALGGGGDVVLGGLERPADGGVAAARLLDHDRLDLLSEERACLLRRRQVAGDEDDRDAERSEDGGIEAGFAVWLAVDPQLVNGNPGDRVRVDGVVGLGHRVVADEERCVERPAVGALELAVVAGIGAAGHQVGGRVEVLEEDVPHRAVAVGDEDVLGPSPDGALDRGVGVARHEAPASVVLAALGAHHVAVDNTGDPLHVDRDVDVHRASPPSLTSRFIRRAW